MTAFDWKGASRAVSFRPVGVKRSPAQVLELKRRIFEMRATGMSHGAIAKALGVTRQYVQQTEKLSKGTTK